VYAFRGTGGVGTPELSGMGSPAGGKKIEDGRSQSAKDGDNKDGYVTALSRCELRCILTWTIEPLHLCRELL
jgi:hypothetical protein